LRHGYVPMADSYVKLATRRLTSGLYNVYGLLRNIDINIDEDTKEKSCEQRNNGVIRVKGESVGS
jgi:hypothetical protein